MHHRHLSALKILWNRDCEWIEQMIVVATQQTWPGPADAVQFDH
jgi:hypothetical protein